MLWKWAKLVGGMHLIPTKSNCWDAAKKDGRSHAFLTSIPAIVLLVILAGGYSNTTLLPISQPSLDGLATALQDQPQSVRAPVECFEHCRGLEPDNSSGLTSSAWCMANSGRSTWHACRSKTRFG